MNQILSQISHKNISPKNLKFFPPLGKTVPKKERTDISRHYSHIRGRQQWVELSSLRPGPVLPPDLPQSPPLPSASHLSPFTLLHDVPAPEAVGIGLWVTHMDTSGHYSVCWVSSPGNNPVKMISFSSVCKSYEHET